MPLKPDPPDSSILRIRSPAYWRLFRSDFYANTEDSSSGSILSAIMHETNELLKDIKILRARNIPLPGELT